MIKPKVCRPGPYELAALLPVDWIAVCLVEQAQLMTIGLSKNGCLHSGNQFDERKQDDWSRHSGLMCVRQSLLF